MQDLGLSEGSPLFVAPGRVLTDGECVYSILGCEDITLLRLACLRIEEVLSSRVGASSQAGAVPSCRRFVLKVLLFDAGVLSTLAEIPAAADR